MNTLFLNPSNNIFSFSEAKVGLLSGIEINKW